MRMTVIQPSYFPSVSELSRISQADVIVWANRFIYKKHSTINRTRIKTVSGPSWLTIPVLTAGQKRQYINEAVIDQAHFVRHGHLKSIEVSYQNSPYYFFFADEIAEIIKKRRQHLGDLLLETTRFLLKKCRLRAKIVMSSDLPQAKDRTHRVIQWMKACQCDEYLVRRHDLPFINSSMLAARTVKIFDFAGLKYHQLFSGFINDLSGLDLLFNEGEMSATLLKRAAKLEIHNDGKNF